MDKCPPKRFPNPKPCPSPEHWGGGRLMRLPLSCGALGGHVPLQLLALRGTFGPGRTSAGAASRRSSLQRRIGELYPIEKESVFPLHLPGDARPRPVRLESGFCGILIQEPAEQSPDVLIFLALALSVLCLRRGSA